MATARLGRLASKVCIVTGAGSPLGIGWASIRRFAEEGARRIYALDFNTKNFSALEKEAQTKFPNTKMTFVQADATDEDAIMETCETAVKQEGQLDVFFANAGVLGSSYEVTCEEETLENFMRIIKNNAASQFLALKHAPRYMDNRAKNVLGRGSIILTASVASFRGGFSPMAYNAGKAASVSMTQTAAVELLRKGRKVRVNAVAPGFIKTNLMPGPVKVNEELAPEYFTDPISVANAVLYLASEESDFVNGETIVIDNSLINGMRLDKIIA